MTAANSRSLVRGAALLLAALLLGGCVDAQQKQYNQALLASEDNDFLIRMGLSRDLLTDVMYQQQAVGNEDDPSTRYCLTADELLLYNVHNGKAE